MRPVIIGRLGDRNDFFLHRIDDERSGAERSYGTDAEIRGMGLIP